nr:sorting nexin-17 [Pelodiscus sinensis]|eukprot:XP_014434755.1 sorting nexin-17 [Pelodiscus sinensis]
MLSICLQSMVDELMVKKSGGSIRKLFRRRANGALRRSDSQQAVKSPPLLAGEQPLWLCWRTGCQRLPRQLRFRGHRG